MAVLKFRIMYEEDESVFRDVEIKPAQTMMELESVILSSYNLPATGNGRFFLSNDNWQKGRQVYPLAMQETRAPKGKAKAQAIPVLVSFIDDPHQHFVYEYAGSVEFTFLIELLSVTGQENHLVAYPVMVRTQGPSPFKKDEPAVHYSRKGAAAPVVAEEEEEEEADAPAEEEAVFVASDDEADTEELAELGREEGGDLMDGDAIKEDGGDEEESDGAMGDDFSPEEFSGDAGEEAEEEDFR